MHKRLLLLILSLVLLLPAAPVSANSPEEPLPLIISEVYPNAALSPESGNPQTSATSNEFIELYNASDTSIDLTGYSLSREGTATVTLLDGLSIEPKSYVAIFPTFPLVNSGGTVLLHYPPTQTDEVIIEVNYPSFASDELHSWSLVGETWQTEIPTPSEANPEPEIPEEPSEEPEDPSLSQEETPPACAVTTVFINEIVANPAGSDSDGGEFVELHNDSTNAVSLNGCVLSTDKLSALSLDGISIPAHGYYAIALTNDLLNNGGTVTFITDGTETAVLYPALGDDESWSFIGDTWQASSVMTPGTENKPSPVVGSTTSDDDELAPCPVGKFRNPETNRCKNVVDAASSLLPCAPGSVRNPETNRCRKITSVASSLKPCASDQERNPETNRCRKVESTTNQLKPCEEGYERNPDTNRCRKVVAAVSGASTPDNTQSARGLHNNVLILITLLALLYAVYEYRLDLLNFYDERLKHSRFMRLFGRKVVEP